LRAMRSSLGPDPAAAQWQGLMDAMRPHWPEIWQSFPSAEKRRFLHHGATFWNVHRHRLAPRIGEFLQEGLSDNIRLLKGRLSGLALAKDGVTAAIAQNGHKIVLPVGRVINCTGPNSDPEKTHDRLIENLVASRLARGAEASIGLDVDGKNRVRDAAGIVQPSLLAMGALTR